MNYKGYILNTTGAFLNGVEILSPTEIADSILFANNAIKQLGEHTKQFDIDIFETLGMRNLSGFVGEVLVSSIDSITKQKLSKNLHQDGYPDLLLNDSEEKKNYLKTTFTIKDGKKYPKSKELFSPYKYGGLEVKATCGSTPSQSSTFRKPIIGEKRIQYINGFDWKAHHRTTNNLIGVLWDFIDGIPTIVAAFYRNDLLIDDWGAIVQPKEGGGRTTSVSIMTSAGVKKMCEGWIAILDSEPYIEKLSNKKWVGYNVKTKISLF